MNQQVYIGPSALEQFQEVLRQLAPRKIFLVRGNKSYAACGAEALLDRIFCAEKIEVVPFIEFSVNPKYDEAERGMQKLITSGATCIVAVGGGSAMDMAKLIRHFYLEQLPAATCQLLALPTTSGTGAEATHFAVVYKEGVKQSIEADDILPDYAFVYAPFTYGASPYLTACTGFDALAQAFEAYWNRNATDESRSYSLKAIDLLWHQLPKLLTAQLREEEKVALRNEIAEGAYWAGRAINITKTTAPHAFSYAFTSHCGYPHGHAVALTFPFFFALNLQPTDPVVAHVGLHPAQLETQISGYVQKLGLSYRGCEGANLKELLSKVNLQRLKNNPVEVTPEIISDLFCYFNRI